MTVADALAQFSSRADGEVLVAHALARSRAWVFAHPEHRLSAEEERTVRSAAARRAASEPVAYITGVREFCGRPFHCDRRALVPRPATEELCAAARAWWRSPQDFCREIDAGICAAGLAFPKKGEPRAIVDIGTGTGCIAVTLALDVPEARIVATDIDPAALELARENAGALGAMRVEWRLGSCLEPLADFAVPFVVVSNPPYVPASHTLPADVSQHEPANALFAGPDGTDILRVLAGQSARHPYCCGLLLECRDDQVGVLVEALRVG